MKYYTKYRLLTFIYILIAYTLIQFTINAFNITDIYLIILVGFVFIFILRKYHRKTIDGMAHKKMKTFVNSCKVSDLEDYNKFIGLRSKRILNKKRRFGAMYYHYLTSFYLYNGDFKETQEILNFFDESLNYGVSKIQLLNIEMLKFAIKGDFEEVEDTYNELVRVVEVENKKYDSDSVQMTTLDNILDTLTKFVGFTKEVNEETVEHARNWINTQANLYNAIDNYCIIKILEHNSDTLYIEEFKENLRAIEGDIPFLDI